MFRYEKLIYNNYLHLFTNILTSEGGKGGRCLGLTTLPSSCADCLEILLVSTCWSLKYLSRPAVGYFYCIKLVIIPLLSKRAVVKRTEGFFSENI
jgi:hypothetical protein